jgi:YD repeat-containing protein
LDQITETGYENGGAVSNPPYKFTYTSSDAPPYDSKGQDLWGYYNGKTSNTDLTMVSVAATNSPVIFAPEKRMPDSASMMKGMIKSITYPTGGSSTFSFQPNQINTTVTTSIPVNLSVTPASIFTMGTVPADITESKIDQTFTVPSVPSGSTIQQYTLNFSGRISDGCTAGNGNCTTNSPRVVLINQTTGVTVFDHTLTLLDQGQQSTESFTESILVSNNRAPLPGEVCRLYFVNQGSPSAEKPPLYVLSASVTQNIHGYQEQVQNKTVYAGGLRIKQISHTDPVTGKKLLKTYNYTKTYFICPSAFNGNYFTTFSNLYAQSKWLISGTRSDPSDPMVKYTSNIYYLESPAVSVGGAGNSSVAYEEVEEMQTDSDDGTTLGKTVYTFNTATDFIPNQLPSIRIDNEDIRKQLKSTKIFKWEAGNPDPVLVKEIINTYDNVNNPYPTGSGGDSIKFFIASSDFDFAARSNIPASAPWSATGCTMYEKDIPFTLQALYYHVSRNFLTSTKVIEHDEDGQTQTTVTNYTYGNYTHMQPTQITTTASNMQLKTQTIKYPLDFANVTGTGDDAAGIKNLQNLHVITAPVEKSSYSKNGSDPQVLTSSVLTTYHSTLPLPVKVSVIESAAPVANFAQASVVSGEISKDSRYHPRLNFVYDNSTGNTREQQKVNDTKEVYLWGYNSQYPVARIVGSDYATVSSVVSQSQIDAAVSDDATLRTLLNTLRTDSRTKNALVTTYTYAPLIGITSETAPNGRTTYYEYDGFGRLKQIRDQDNHIIKKFDYQYQQTQ